MRAALEAATGAPSQAALVEVVAAYPELRTREPLAEWQADGEFDEASEPRTAGRLTLDRLTGALLADLVQYDIEEAWWRRTVQVEHAVSQNLEELHELALGALHWYGIGVVNQELADNCALLAERAENCGELRLAGVLWDTRGKVLQHPKLASASNTEEAIRAYERAVTLYEELEQHAAAATVKHNLAGALSERARDRAASIERGIALLEEVIASWTALPDPEGVAMARTNLAVLLLDRKRGAVADNARRALNQCRAALRYRSLERDPVDYFYSLANLALAQQRLAESDDRYLRDAESTYGKAFGALSSDLAPWLRARLHSNFTDFLVATAEKLPDERNQRLRRAEEHSRQAVAIHGAHGHAELPFTQRQLARVLVRRAESDPASASLHEACDLYLAALEVLTPGEYPADCMRVADRAAELSVRLDDWRTASRARMTALAAWRATGGDLVSRGGLPHETGPLADMLTHVEQESRYRDCAYALFRAAWQEIADGQLAAHTPQVQVLLSEAVRLMEDGRATTLRTGTGADAADLARLRAIDPELAEEYVTALREAREESAEAEPTAGGTRRSNGGPARLEPLLEAVRADPHWPDSPAFCRPRCRTCAGPCPISRHWCT
ncbi:hypothetical protein [Streptomyces sp. NPDC101206]|uniref:hypothetical protein n=1 Tax=Streptomyces sp. NPDC101206 TaxID=3366128 RepID=UPI00381328A2